VIVLSHTAQSCACGDGEYRCTDGQCVDSDKFCDGVDDCPFGEDEMDCRKLILCLNVINVRDVMLSHSVAVMGKCVWFEIRYYTTTGILENIISQKVFGVYCPKNDNNENTIYQFLYSHHKINR